MKTAVITCGYYDKDYEEKLARLKYSCDVFGIDLKVYREIGKAFNFFDAKIEKLGVFIDSLKNDYTHVLYTDASDSFFLAPLLEIEEKYLHYFNDEVVVSGEKGCHPFPEYMEHFTSPSPWKYMNPGNFIGPIPKVLDIISKLKTYKDMRTNDQGPWMEAYVQKRIQIKIDTECMLFQTMSDIKWLDYETYYAGIKNIITANSPCILHFNGPKDALNTERANRIFTHFKEVHESI
jgi:hypothetical protein